MLLLVSVALGTRAQNYANLELVENKGQWPAQVKFKASLPTGAFFLQPNGYKMLLNNPQDMQRFTERAHLHTPITTASDSNISNISINNPAAGEAAPDRIVLRSHAYEMKFLHASGSPQIIPDKPLDTYNNYFIDNDPSKWASHCRIFQAVTYKNVYPGVDVRYYTNDGRLKYDIVVNPGASLDKIAMYFDGVDGLEVKNDRLVIKTSVDEVQELKPYTYQPLSAGRKEIGNSYIVEGNIVRFKLGAYDKTRTLVIDPTVIFSTFSGSTADNWGYTATYDNDGNFYGGGIVFGQGFPVSNGAFQTTYAGGVSESSYSPYDIGIIKLNPTGSSRIYATYLGGSTGNEQPQSLVADAQGNLVIAGRTNSSNYPGTVYGQGGGWDIVLTKINASGTALIGSRRIGGTGDDGINIRNKTAGGTLSLTRNYGDDARSEVILDGAGNVYLASCTQSPNFPVTANAFQTTIGLGTTPAGAPRIQDGLILKASPDLSNIIFASFLGGDGDDAAFVLALNPSNGNIYTAGGTTSDNFPGTGITSQFPAYQGGVTDGYVSIISNDGTTLIKSTYMGTTNTDMVYGIQFDKSGFPYIMGTTDGSALWPTTSNVTFKIVDGKEFICKLQPDLSGFVYSTTFGKAGFQYHDISPIAFLVDRCENVYISGWGGSTNAVENFNDAKTNGLPVAGVPPGGSILRTTTDGSDFYFFVLERNARSQLFGAFFGAVQQGSEFGEHVDGGTSRFDQNGVIYQALCGYCGGGINPFPTTSGSWSPTNRALPRCNLAMVKIAMELSGVAAGVKSFVEGSPRKMGCIPLTVDFSDTLSAGTKYVWRFGDGSPDETTTSASNSHTYNAIGSYTVRLVSIDSSTCNIADTSYTTITVRQDIAQLNGYAEKLPPCEGLSYRFHNTSVPPAAPGKPFTTQSFKWDFGDGNTQVAGTSNVDHTFPAKGTYNVKLILIDTNYCNYPDTFNITLRIADNLKADFKTPRYGCAPYNAVLTNTSVGGATFTWDFGDGTTSTQQSPSHLYTIPGDYTIRLTAVDSATCNIIDSTKFTITVSGSPTAQFDYTPKPPQENTAVDYTNASTNAIRYLWRFGDGDSLSTIKRDTIVKHYYNATGTFNTCLIAYNQYACTDTFCIPITARVVPAMDVPNAFTPNGDGVNDEVHVFGFAISKMNWRIYNRWGQVVFSTTNRREGWDGKYKGVLQPQEVYTYTLDVEFSDGTKSTKTGDITLLR